MFQDNCVKRVKEIEEIFFDSNRENNENVSIFLKLDFEKMTSNSHQLFTKISL